MPQGPSPSTRHPITGVERFEENVLYHFDFIGDRLIIGKFCSIAAGVRFLMNGGNHQVASDVPPYATVGGNPARVIRHRFDDATIARHLALRWWDWEIERITRKVRAITGTDLAALESD